ncbi:hypothetical protein [Mucilaginibacter paludis]|uniref:Uncharacterized protein n=1 Tax=Mucilaginibacter paludis DSM 18603 TaxID=714943 RepID=H1YGB2_9SPHI|nr:hypothetical protein [Mucilaginibacter paludis]EHQ27376.1 hypothetical protein Mucpa_3272 [Mucilaginibacter paludis DSM 18603]
MAEVDNENKLIELKDWAKEAMELLDEVKPYRSIFYKQRVAKLKSQLKDIVNDKLNLQLRSRNNGYVS